MVEWPPIRDKRAMYALLRAGQFGNTNRSWGTIGDCLHDPFSGPVAMRYMGTAGGSRCDYHIDQHDLPDRLDEWIAAGFDPARVNYSEMLPESELILQGEVLEAPGGWHLFFSRAKLPMREALRAAPEHASGLRARALVRDAMDPSSFEDLLLQFERWPGHVVEFSAYRVEVGVIPHRSVCFWETRAY